MGRPNLSFAAWIALLLWWGCVAGCGPSGGPSEDDELTNEEFYAEYRKIIGCSKTIDCEPKAGFGLILEFLCHPDRTGQGLVPGSGSDRVEFDAAAAEQCLDALREMPACEVFHPKRSQFGEGSPCEGVYSGTQEPGEPCTENLECTGASRCDNERDCEGTCTETLGEGADCSSGNCESGLVCLPDDTCGTPVGEGEACAQNQHCKGDLVCDDNGECIQLPQGAGDDCSAEMSDTDYWCPGELVCVEGTCQEGAATGESCEDPKKCAPGNRCVDGTCVATVGPGGSCDGSKNCVVTHYCESGSCVPRPTLGGDCSNVPEYWSGEEANFCMEGVCISGTCGRRSPGESCEPGALTSTCKDGYCEEQGEEDEGICRETKSEGSDCMGDQECGEGLVCRTDRGTCGAACPDE